MLHAQLASSKVRNSLFFSVLIALLTACGGGSDAPAAPASTPSPPSNPAPEVVTGVATPDSVAVVTATNAS